MRSAGVGILFVLVSAAVAAETGRSLSDVFFAEMLKAGLSPAIQYASGKTDAYPYNIVQTFHGSSGADSGTALVLVFAQEEWADDPGSLASFIAAFSEAPPAGRTVFLVTAGDVPRVRAAPRGSASYLANSDINEETSFLVLVVMAKKGFGRPPQVIPGTGEDPAFDAASAGSSGITAPLSLIKQLPFPVAGNSTAFYRFGLAGREGRIDIFRDAGVGVAAVILDPGVTAAEDFFQDLTGFVSAFRADGSTEVNYSLFPNAITPLYVGEKAFITIYLALMGMGIFSLCLHKNRGLILLLPLGLSVFVLQRASSFAITAIGGPPTDLLLFLTSSLLLPFFLLSALVIAFFALAPERHIEYGYLICFQSLVNLGVFGSMDFYLLADFTLLLVIAQFLRHSKRALTFAVAAFLSFATYLPIIYAIAENADFSALYRLVTGNAASKVTPTLLALPFMLMWLAIADRILRNTAAPAKLPGGAKLSAAAEPAVSTGEGVPFPESILSCRLIPGQTGAGISSPLSPEQVTRRAVFTATGVTLAVASVLIAGTIFASRLLPFKNVFLSPVSAGPSFPESPERSLKIEVSSDVYFEEYEIVTITVSSKKGTLLAADLGVKLAGNAEDDGGDPFSLATSDPFGTSLSPRSLVFSPPEYPPDPVTVTYNAPRGAAVEIDATLYVIDEKGIIIKETGVSSRGLSKTSAFQNPPRIRINSGPGDTYSKNRQFTSFDMFPLLVESIGGAYAEKGLGLGRSINRGEKSLLEEFGDLQLCNRLVR